MLLFSTTTFNALPLGFLPKFVSPCTASCHNNFFLRVDGVTKFQTRFQRRLSTDIAPRKQPVDHHCHFRKAATWLAPDASKVQPQDLLANLPQLDPGKYSGLHKIVFLVTPSFAYWLEKDSSFLQQAVNRLCGKGFGEISTISTVVDRIPGHTYEILENKIPVPRAQSLDAGSEGISILLTSAKMSFHKAKYAAKADADINSTINFISRKALANDPAVKHARRVISVPAANTMFLNANRSTMFLDRWKVEKDGAHRYAYLSREKLANFDITLSSRLNTKNHVLHLDDEHKPAYHVNVPLRPLTERREIVSSMGNVVRELKDEKTGKVFPASTELEEAVPRFIETLKSDTSRANIRVFAIISRKQTPPNGSNPESMTESSYPKTGAEPFISRMLLAAFFKDVKLYRVTGGGGGWGKKKGLLALDPAREFWNKEQTRSPALPDSELDPEFGKTAELASPGDQVQFFTTLIGVPVPDTPVDTVLANSEKPSTAPESHWDLTEFPRIILGMNPLQEDYTSLPPSETGTENKLDFIPDQFGMYSEGGISISVRKPLTVFISRFDVPYTTIVTPKRSMTHQSIEDGNVEESQSSVSGWHDVTKIRGNAKNSKKSSKNGRKSAAASNISNDRNTLTRLLVRRAQYGEKATPESGAAPDIGKEQAILRKLVVRKVRTRQKPTPASDAAGDVRRSS